MSVFLIDCRTRQGQSGSPVVTYRAGHVPLENGDAKVTTGFMSKIFGISSDRINNESDIGLV